MLPEGWHRSTLGEIARITSGGTPDRSEPSYWGGNVPWVTTGEIQFNTITDTVEKITEAGLKNSSAKLFPPDTLLMAMYGQGKTRGQVAKLAIEASTNQNSAAILLNEGHIPDFYFQFLSWKYDEIRDAGYSGGLSHLNAGLLKQIPVPVAPVAEQVKIALILSAWDKAVLNAQRLAVNGRLLLDGLRRQMLSPQFNRDVEWSHVRIGQTLREVRRRAEWSDDASYPLISVRRRSEGVVHRETLMGNEILTKKLNVVRAGDFVISKMQVVHGAMGIVPLELDGMFASDSYVTFRSADEDRYLLDYIGCLSKTTDMYRLAYRCSHGVHIEKMTFDLDVFLGERIHIPRSIDDQRMIAERLAAAEQLNLEAIRYAHALKAEKAAVMAQLLTGKRRVQVSEAETSS